jgi:hypothetical protein
MMTTTTPTLEVRSEREVRPGAVLAVRSLTILAH